MIKKIDINDIEKCTEVIKASFFTVVHQFGITQQNAPTHTSFIKSEKLYKQFEQGNRFMFAYFLSDEIVGYFSLIINNENVCELDNLAVLPSYRHYGYGREMVDFAIDFAKKANCKKITISIIEENSILKSWYKSIGFVHIYTKKFARLPFTSGYMEFQL